MKLVDPRDGSTMVPRIYAYLYKRLQVRRLRALLTILHKSLGIYMGG